MGCSGRGFEQGETFQVKDPVCEPLREARLTEHFKLRALSGVICWYKMLAK